MRATSSRVAAESRNLIPRDLQTDWRVWGLAAHWWGGGAEEFGSGDIVFNLTCSGFRLSSPELRGSGSVRNRNNCKLKLTTRHITWWRGCLPPPWPATGGAGWSPWRLPGSGLRGCPRDWRTPPPRGPHWPGPGPRWDSWAASPEHPHADAAPAPPKEKNGKFRLQTFMFLYRLYRTSRTDLLKLKLVKNALEDLIVNNFRILVSAILLRSTGTGI